MDASPNFINHLTNYERAAAARVAATAIADGTDVVATLPVKLPKRRVIATWVEGRLEVAGWDRELGQHVLLRRITPLPYAIAATVPQLLLLEWQFALNVAFTYPAGCFDLTAVDRNSAVIAAIYEAFDEGWQHAYTRRSLSATSKSSNRTTHRCRSGSSSTPSTVFLSARRRACSPSTCSPTSSRGGTSRWRTRAGQPGCGRSRTPRSRSLSPLSLRTSSRNCGTSTAMSRGRCSTIMRSRTLPGPSKTPAVTWHTQSASRARRSRRTRAKSSARSRPSRATSRRYPRLRCRSRRCGGSATIHASTSSSPSISSGRCSTRPSRPTTPSPPTRSGADLHSRSGSSKLRSMAITSRRI